MPDKSAQGLEHNQRLSWAGRIANARNSVPTAQSLDILVYAIGYEARSRHVVEQLDAQRRIGLVFEGHRVLSFDRNLGSARARDDQLIVASEVGASFAAAIENAISAVDATVGAGRPILLGLDVSSMTRTLMTAAIRTLVEIMTRGDVALALLYAPAAYQEPQEEAVTFIDFGPVPGLEGWTMFPERPLSVIIGLGYEVDQAIGTIEYLDPSGVWAFVPNGTDPRFRADLDETNESLWPILDPFHLLEYRIADPYRLYAELRGLTETLSRRSRVILVPGGPKLFSALSILVKLEMGDEVSVWRASPHELLGIRDVKPDGEIIRFDYPRTRLVRPDSGVAEL